MKSPCRLLSAVVVAISATMVGCGDAVVENARVATHRTQDFAEYVLLTQSSVCMKESTIAKVGVASAKVEITKCGHGIAGGGTKAKSDLVRNTRCDTASSSSSDRFKCEVTFVSGERMSMFTEILSERCLSITPLTGLRLDGRDGKRASVKLNAIQLAGLAKMWESKSGCQVDV